MGLKAAGAVAKVRIMFVSSQIKSDQNGIERFFFVEVITWTFTAIKSDQNGIERQDNMRKLLIRINRIKSDQNGIES